MPTNSLTAFEPAPPPEPKTVLRLEGVSVRYRVPQERIPSLKEYAIRRLKRTLSFREFWALDGIDLEIRSGEVVGIIGPNGAGKSTLLKIISRVLYPTRGRVRVQGRVSPLLELGAGFDHELTGRENIFLNGLILGYGQKEIAARLDRIIAFAGLADFIDSPLRTYSSGMLARLGFAIATEKQPDILLIDEILSVGDAEFQRKSLDRINQFRAEGATILMVSHSLEAIQGIATRAVWLERGIVKAEGHVEAVIRRYQGEDTHKEAERLKVATETDSRSRIGTGGIEITRVELVEETGADQTVYSTGQEMTVRIHYRTQGPVDSPVFGLALHRQDGVHICGPNTAFAGLDLGRIEGSGIVSYRIPSLPLLEGLYFVSVAAVNRDDSEIFDYHDRAYPFRVMNISGAQKEKYGFMTLQGVWSQP